MAAVNRSPRTRSPVTDVSSCDARELLTRKCVEAARAPFHAENQAMSAINLHSRTARVGTGSDHQAPALTHARRRLASRSVSNKLHLAIPRVLCPSCGELMRLSRIDPSNDGGRRGQTTTFECSCGDDYRQTIRERV